MNERVFCTDYHVACSEGGRGLLRATRTAKLLGLQGQSNSHTYGNRIQHRASRQKASRKQDGLRVGERSVDIHRRMEHVYDFDVVASGGLRLLRLVGNVRQRLLDLALVLDEVVILRNEVRKQSDLASDGENVRERDGAGP